MKSIQNEFAGISPSPSMTKKERSLKKSKSLDKEPIKVQHSGKGDRKKRKMHSWFRKWKAKRISSFGKRHKKVANNNNDNDSCSVSTHAFSVSTLATRSIVSIASSRRRRKKKRRKTDHDTKNEPVSILRRSTLGASNPSLDLTSLDCASDGGASAGVKFAKGTVFQDPNQTERRRCPRLPGRQKRPGTDKNHRGITHKRVLALRKAKQASGSQPSLDATMKALSLDEGNGCNPMEELTPLVDAVVAATAQSMGCSVYR